MATCCKCETVLKATKQVNGKAKIRPLTIPKLLNRSSQKLAGVITSLMEPGMQNFVAIDSGVSALQIRDFAVPLGWLFFVIFLGGFFNMATPYTPQWIITQNMSNDVVPGKEVPFGGPDDYILYLDPYISEKPLFWQLILTKQFFLQPKTL